MARLSPIKKEEAPAELQPIYEMLGKGRGGTPFNIFQLMANSPTALQAFVSLMSASNKTLSPNILERISLLVAQQNGCNYCLAAHSMLAKNVANMSDAEIKQARQALADEPKTLSMLQFVKSVLSKQGKISDSDFAALKAAGVTDKETVDLILAITVNIFTNYFNNCFQTDIDFPPALPL
jgi:uncharacterized peroxidase-related enzyme